MSKHNKPTLISTRLTEAEKQIKDLRQRVAVLSLLADFLAARGIVSESELQNHAAEVAKRVQQSPRN